MFERHVAMAAHAHGRAEYPREAVGLVVDGHYVACENVAADPKNGFEIDNGLIVQYGSSLQALIHSHPEDWPVPTAVDMRQQQAMGLPWGIYAVRADDAGKTGGEPLNCSQVIWFGDGAAKEPVFANGRGRGFIHGHQDCVSTVLDWHRLQGIEMPEPPRDWGWWLERKDPVTGAVTPAGDLYRDNFEAYGFERVDGPIVGAVGMVALGRHGEPGKIAKPVLIPNHAAVYLGNNLILHHLTAMKPIDLTRLSMRDPAVRRGNIEPIWVRHKQLPLTGLKAIA